MNVNYPKIRKKLKSFSPPGKENELTALLQKKKPQISMAMAIEDKTMDFLSIGSMVEVKIKNPGFIGAWYEGKILESYPKPKGKFMVEYQNHSNQRLKETVDISLIRPLPPPPVADQTYNLNDVVDALCGNGWWKGVVSEVNTSGTYRVVFETLTHQLYFSSENLRMHLDWSDGRWLRPPTQEVPNTEDCEKQQAHDEETFSYYYEKCRKENSAISLTPSVLMKSAEQFTENTPAKCLTHDSGANLPLNTRKNIVKFSIKYPKTDYKRKRGLSRTRVPLDDSLENIKFKYPFSLNTKASIEVRADFDVMKTLKSNLSKKQMEMFKRSCFGHLVDIEFCNLSTPICHGVLTREITPLKPKHREMWFNVKGVELKFGDWEFGLITGLRFGDMKPILQRMSNLEKKNRLRDMYFGGSRSLTNKQIYEAFEKTNWHDEEDCDAVFMAMLYVIHRIFFTPDPAHSVDNNIIDLTDFPKLFDEFPWGVVAWEETYRSMERAINGLSRKEKFEDFSKGKINIVMQYQLIGLSHAFQVWILEIWKAPRKFYIKRASSVLPRLSRWITAKNPTFIEVWEVFSSSEAPEFQLVMEDAEKACVWSKKLQDYIDDRAVDIESLFESYETVEEEEDVEEEEEEEVEVEEEEVEEEDDASPMVRKKRKICVPTELREEQRAKLKSEIKAEVVAELREQIKREIRAELKSEIAAEVIAELREEMRRERKAMAAQITSELREEPKANALAASTPDVNVDDANLVVYDIEDNTEGQQKTPKSDDDGKGPAVHTLIVQEKQSEHVDNTANHSKKFRKANSLVSFTSSVLMNSTEQVTESTLAKCSTRNSGANPPLNTGKNTTRNHQEAGPENRMESSPKKSGRELIAQVTGQNVAAAAREDEINEDPAEIINVGNVVNLNQSVNVQAESEPVARNENLPFRKSSYMWNHFDSLEVFRILPQNPHFSPLLDCNEETREGAAIGHMWTFASVVEKVTKLQINDPITLFNSYLEALEILEAIGFDVEALADRVNQLLFLKIKQEKLDNQSKRYQSLVAESDEKKAKLEQEISAIDKMVSELEEQRALKVTQMVKEDSSREFLQLEVSSIKDAMFDVEHKFKVKSAAPWRRVI
ncbi:uncharacterized protein [Euphorbia lathyris]|uniref:uncharacterized protein n=1 Tax=Euphorbia lathyris TaxID=212925 RepID=UPI003314372A